MLGQLTEKYAKYLKNTTRTHFDLNVISSTLGRLFHPFFKEIREPCSPLSDTAVSPGHGRFNVDWVIAQTSELQGFIQ